MSVKYCLPVPVFHFWPQLSHRAARSFYDSWATCFTVRSVICHISISNRLSLMTLNMYHMLHCALRYFSPSLNSVKYPFLTCSVLLLRCDAVTLTWPWTFLVYRMSCGQTLYQILAKSLQRFSLCPIWSCPPSWILPEVYFSQLHGIRVAILHKNVKFQHNRPMRDWVIGDLANFPFILGEGYLPTHPISEWRGLNCTKYRKGMPQTSMLTKFQKFHISFDTTAAQSGVGSKVSYSKCWCSAWSYINGDQCATSGHCGLRNTLIGKAKFHGAEPGCVLSLTLYMCGMIVWCEELVFVFF